MAYIEMDLLKAKVMNFVVRIFKELLELKIEFLFRLWFKDYSNAVRSTSSTNSRVLLTGIQFLGGSHKTKTKGNFRDMM